MNSSQVEINLKNIVNTFDKETFIYELLVAYGISRTTVTRLKKGDFNLSKVPGEVLYKKKVLFKEVLSDSLLTTIDEITKNEESLKHNPRFVIVTDFKTLLAKDTRTGLTLDIPILEIDKHFHFFLPWAGQEKYQQKNDNHADRKASYEMAKLYDILVHENPNIYDDGGHNLNIFLSRILFCFFAEDTNIFPVEGMFTDTLAQHTNTNGSDVDSFLDRLFLKLNTEFDNDAPAFLKEFPYVNGGLFNDTIKSPKFSSKARKIILECGELNWSEINPDIFGSMIQAVVNPEYRSGLGMHYTSVPNIMKVIEPLFLNELNEEFDKSKDSPAKLKKLINRISKLKVFDPACGSGNFLIIAYKELRRLEIKILQQINELEAQVSIVFTQIKLSQCYGIELDDFAHEMAILSLWLAEHQMNKEFEDDLHDFGKAKPILPLKEAGHITQGNATRIDWEKACPKSKNDEIYILGNPPYLGYSRQDIEQKKDMEIVFSEIRDYKKLDYISCWFIKASNFISKTNHKFSFVTTNSITQGEQVALLWPFIFSKELEIGFAHTSFKWTNNAKGNAGVSVVIIGLQNILNQDKHLFYNGLTKKVANINAYLIEGSNVIVNQIMTPISELPNMIKGSSPGDGGNLLLNENELNIILKENPQASKFIKKYLGADEFLYGKIRYCILVNKDDYVIANSIKPFNERFEKVKKMRLASKKEATRKKASFPYEFDEKKYKESDSIIIPQTSSELRPYIPVGFLNSDVVISNAARVIYDAEPWMFGLLSSNIHFVWVKAVAGRLETRIQYSNTLCYNTFPFPTISEKQKENINLHVFAILEEREKYPEKNLAQLYDASKIPKGLKAAHHELDLAIERCYRLKPFESDVERLEFLFNEYEKMTIKKDLFSPEKTKKIKIK
ncbi:class I SAM-dependent DNA methyltransferase [Flavobacterium psychrophilum]|uniref:class I SAM-dependent DNA methyltransferase n=1 Tax=Flavobacterium psychrophilum TaxID=96345 RepID=UPI0004E7D097|nr:DNA methyltransferase [Flavobacterium psychrophilum]AIJ37067.1 DNA modification methyltransferase-related protein [Flavobacterium psychrophilum]ELI6455766.1 class I SAM-dependent DNA methyltransferase [Flavobacterium psychrophilum]